MDVRVVALLSVGDHAVQIVKGNVIFLVEVHVRENAQFLVMAHAALLVQMLPTYIIKLTNETEKQYPTLEGWYGEEHNIHRHEGLSIGL